MSGRPAPPRGRADAESREDHGGEDATAQEAALRAEHDELAERLWARRSIDLLRRATYGGFAGLLTLALAVKLGVDRWRPALGTQPRPEAPLFFALAALASLSLLVFAAAAFVRARAHMREEDAHFARFRELRSRLRIDR